MRIIIAILFLLYVLDLQGRDPHFGINKDKSVEAISSQVIKSTISINSKATGLNSELNTNNSLFTHFTALNKEIYRRERYYIKSKFSGRTEPLLKTTNIKLGYKYVVLPIPVKESILNKHSFLLNSSPFVSVLLNRKSIYSLTYNYYDEIGSDQPDSLFDLGVSIGAGIRVPITSKFLLDVGVRDELGLLNLDGFILGTNSFSQNNSIGVILGLKYKI